MKQLIFVTTVLSNTITHSTNIKERRHIMATTSQQAQRLALKRLREKYREELKAMYREAVVELGGTLRTAKTEQAGK